MIPEYHRILYATDLSPNSAQAFRHALGLALRYGGRIHILHVVPETETAVVNYVATVMGEDRLADLELGHKDELRREIEGRVDRFTRDELADAADAADSVASIRVVHGDPADRILEEAEALKADLIVLGSHSRGRLRHVLLGSVAERVLRKSVRPVFVSRLVDTNGPA